MEKEKLERAKKIQGKINSVNAQLTILSESTRIIFKVGEYGNRMEINPKTDANTPDTIFAEEIRTLVFQYYKLKQRELELELKLL